MLSANFSKLFTLLIFFMEEMSMAPKKPFNFFNSKTDVEALSALKESMS